MPGKWDWLKDEIGFSNLLTGGRMILRVISGKLSADDLTKCALCPNMCRHACPVSIVEGRETTSPAGKARVAFMIREGRLELNTENLEPLYMCLSCDICSLYCPFEFSVADLIRPVKEDAVRKGVIFEEFRGVFENLERYGDVYGAKKEEKDGRGEILYIRGCTIRNELPELGEKTLDLLRKLGFEVFTIDETCCGIPAYNLGNIELFKKLAAENAERINRSGAEIVVTSCPSCAYAYRVLYPGHGIRIRPRVFHIAEFLKDKVGGMKGGTYRVTYHNPCRLALGLGQKELLKDLLSGIEGIELRAPGKELFCCGHGGSAVSRLNPELAEEIAEERRKQLMEGADTAITACPSCKLALGGDGLKVLDIAEFLWLLTGEGYEPEVKN
ncbi:(Fe-S)-binding protein [Thermococcus atlanticus]